MRTLTSAETFKFWGGARDTVEMLTKDELERVFDELMECSDENLTETEINDFFWFDTDTLANWLGYDDYEMLINSRYSISFDNGRTFTKFDELRDSEQVKEFYEKYGFNNGWPILNNAFDEKVCDELNKTGFYTEDQIEYLSRYLQISKKPLIIG